MSLRALVLVVLCLPCLSVATEIDKTGLLVAENWGLVKAHCTVCHSAKLVTQNRMSRDGWRDTITWMQKKHNLWDLGVHQEKVLDYLEAHYGTRALQQIRRRNLAVQNK